MKRFLLSIIILVVSITGFSTECDMLIITITDYSETLARFAQYKNKIGIKTEILTVDAELDYIEINNEIREFVDEFEEIPKYVLFVGADYQLRYGYKEGATTDCYYCDFDDDGYNDMYPGRFPCFDEEELNRIILKTMRYETNPIIESDDTWFLKSTLTLVSGLSSSEFEYWRCVYHCDSVCQANGFIETDTMAGGYGPYDGFDLQNRVNEGRGYVIYRGEGVDGWGGFEMFEPYSLTNYYKTPIVSGTTCATIPNFGPEWLGAGTPTLPSGALAYLGTNTVGNGYTLSLQRSAMAIGFCEGFCEGLPLGEAAEQGRLYLLDIPDYRAWKEYNGCILLGDPSVKAWTKVPDQLEITHSETFSSSGIINATVTELGSPCYNTLVCLMYKDEVYLRDYTNEHGEVSFIYDIESTISAFDSMYITASKWNSMPVFSTILSEAAISENKPENIKINKAYPNPFNSSITFDFQSETDVELEIIDVFGNIVLRDFINDGGNISYTWEASDIISGVYFVKIKSGDVESHQKITLIK